MKTRSYLIPCLVIVSVLSMVITAERASAQLRKLTTEALTNKAECVAIGKVTGMRSEWNKDKTRIYTHVTISVDQYVKGERSEKYLTITHLGGEVREIGELYTHAPKFSIDEEVLIFVKKDKKNNLRITGGANGKLRITKSAVTGEKMIRKTILLDDFTSQIKSIVKKQQEK